MKHHQMEPQSHPAQQQAFSCEVLWYRPTEKSIKSFKDYTQDCRIIFENNNESLSEFIHRGLELIKSEYVCVLVGELKFKINWLNNLYKHHRKKTIAFPVVYELDTKYWESIGNALVNPSFRWDLRTIDGTRPDCLPTICYFTEAEWLNKIGISIFAENGAENIDLTVRNYCHGGDIIQVRDSIISGVLLKDSSVYNRKCLIDSFFPSARPLFQIYEPSSLLVKPISTANFEDSPSLYAIYRSPILNRTLEMFNKHQGEDFVILNYSKHVDNMPSRFLRDSRVVLVGGDKFPADYAFVKSTNDLEKFGGAFRESQLISPSFIIDSHSAELLDITSIMSQSNVIDLVDDAGYFNGFYPAFDYKCDFLNVAGLVRFMGAKSITFINCDFSDSDLAALNNFKYFSSSVNIYRMES